MQVHLEVTPPAWQVADFERLSCPFLVATFSVIDPSSSVAPSEKQSLLAHLQPLFSVLGSELEAAK